MNSPKVYFDQIDKSTWPAGPWNEEPDEVFWIDEETGYGCLALRRQVTGWCGYVGIPRDHKLFGIERSIDDWLSRCSWRNYLLRRDGPWCDDMANLLRHSTLAVVVRV